jgi:hypothetical protein
MMLTRTRQRASGCAFSVEFSDPDLEGEAEALLEYISEQIGSSQDFSRVFYYGFWPVTLRWLGQRLDVFEASDDLGDFVHGANRTLRIAADQRRLCDEAFSLWVPPQADQIAAVWPGLQDRPVEGMRYRPEGAMSGWWIMPVGFTGNFRDMVPEHLYHLAEARPDVVPLLGLAPGFVFDQQSQRVWFEGDVLNS